MIKLILFHFILFSNLCYSQDTIQTVEFVGECYNENGLPFNANGSYFQRYNPKHHKKKNRIEINIRAIKIGPETVIVNFRHVEKVGCETAVLRLNDNYGVKLLLARTVENGKNIFLYKLPVFNLDAETGCWRSISTFNGYYEVYSKNIMLNGYRIGNLDSVKMFAIVEGFINID